MTNSEKKAMIDQVRELQNWMVEGTGYKLTDLTIEDMLEDDSDIYEVFVVIHLNNGECIRLRNECFKSFVKKQYFGDRMYYVAEKMEYANEGVYDYVEVSYTDDSDGSYHQCKVPISSICYIEGYDVSLNWQNLSKYGDISN